MAFLAVCGNAVAQTYPPPMNLTRYMPVTASSVNESWGGAARYAVDGLVCEESRWISDPVNTPHWLEIALPGSFQIGSANLITGGWDEFAVANFSLQYWTGSAWANIPGATITGNTQTQRQIIFSSPVTTDKVRFYSDQDGWIAVKELAVFPPNGGVGYPIGTEIDLRSAMLPKITASSQQDANFRPYLAYDGYVADNSRWLSANVTTQHWLEYAFVKEREVAYAHIYTGLGAGSAIANFTLQYWDANTTNWVAIPGGSVTGNTSTTNVLTFTSTIRTTKVRLVSDDDGTIRVKEMVFLPPNGGTGYPVGTGVIFSSPPSQRWGNSAGNDTDGLPPFSDSFYKISNRAAGLNLRTAPDGTVTVETVNNSFSQQYNILLNIGTDTYRICNRANEHCLEVAVGSLAEGAVVQEGDYNALPYQQWRLVVNGSYYELVNVYSGLLLTVNGTGSVPGTGLIQMPDSSSNAQQWSFSYVTHFPKKGSSTSEVTGDFVTKYKSSHYYDWTLDPNSGVSATHHQPMWWNNSQTRTERLVLVRPEWAVSDVPKYLFGYNEPNHGDQANMSVQTALDEWSRMEQVKLPLIGPQHDWAWGSWYTSFFDQADAMGLRIDEGGGHIYPTASSVNYDSFSSGVTDGYNAQNGRVQWVTEWNWVNWGGAATWTDDQLYSVMAETLWRYENNPWVKRHEFFAFSRSWPNGAPGALEDDTSNDIILPLGRLYAAWDGDLNYRTNTWYIVHNRGTHKQLKNNGGLPASATIDTVDSSINWSLSPAGSGKYYVVSVDGKRLSYNGSAVSLSAAGTTGTTVEWTLTPIQYGWYYLDHPATGQRLDCDINTGALAMYGNANTWDTLRWRFILPYVPDPTWMSDSSGNWSDTTKWSGGTPANGASQTADFSYINITTDRTVTLDSSRTIGDLKFGDAAGGQNWALVASGGAILTLASTDVVVNNNTATISAPLAGTTGFSKSGAGTLVLPNANGYSGTTTLYNGTTAIGNNGVFGTSTVDLRGGGIQSSDATARTVGNAITFSADTAFGGSGNLLFTGAVNAGSLSKTFTVNNSRTEFSGVISGSGPRIKAGNGTLIFSAANTYTGTTTVSNGTLLVNGSIGSSGVTVRSGATLGGNGTINGVITVGSGGILSPGTSIGVLTAGTSVTLQSGCTTIIEINRANSPKSDRIVLNSGTLTYGGTLTVTNLGPVLQSGDSFQLFSASGYAGSFSATNLPPLNVGLAWKFTPANGTLSVATSVATNPTNVAMSVSGNTLTLSWPADYIGWTLQTQTNPLSVGLSTNWVPVAGSATTNQMQIPMDASNGSVFFQLVYTNAL